MKAVILAGGRGTRLLEETQIKPKPLVEAGGKALIWHIMQNYAKFGITEFLVLVGYKGNQIREYFANFWMHQSDVTFDLSKPGFEVHQVRSVPWKVTIIDTGIDTATGSRLLFLKDLLNDDFMLTYGDGVADVDIELLKQEHIKSNNIVTLTAVKPPARFGALDLAANKVISFQEKPLGEGSWVNGGFFMCTNEVFDFLFEKNCSFEIDTLPKIAAQKKLGAYKHDGFWQPVDTIRDLQRLEEAIGDKKLTWINR